MKSETGRMIRRNRAAELLDLTLRYANRGPRTDAARVTLATWLDKGVGAYAKSMKWLESVLTKENAGLASTIKNPFSGSR